MNRDGGCSSNAHRLLPLRSRIRGGTATASSASWSSEGRPVSKIQADETTSSSQLHPKADVQIECHSRAGRRLVKNECSCCKSATTDHQRPSRSRVHDGGTAVVASPLSPNEERPSTNNKARKAASGSQLLPKTDIKKERKSRAGRQLVKKRQCRCCESDTHHEHQLSASKSTRVNHSHRAERRSTESRASSVNTARRKLILGDAQGAVALCAPKISCASSKNTMTEQHRKPTPIVDNEERASNVHLRVKSRLTRRKQNPYIEDTSGPQSAAACKNNISANHHTSPSVFEKHVATSPPKVLAEGQICSGTNASPRKIPQSQFRDANSSSSTHQQPLYNQVCDDGAPAAASSAFWPNRAQPTSKNKARKATSSSQLLLKADSQEEYNLRAGQQSVKKDKCGSCRSIPCNEHQPSPSKSSEANYLCGAASSHAETQASSVKTARRKLILDDAQGAATLCTPAMGHEEHASNARLGTKPRMTRSKQNPNIKDTSGPQSCGFAR